MRRPHLVLAGGVLFVFLLGSNALAADGFARQTTGGAGGTPVDVNTASAFKSAVESTSTYIVQVSGTIDLGSVGGAVQIRSNKTIIGVTAGAKIIGRLGFRDNASNVIIEKLIITNPHAGDTYDGISVHDAITNLFVTKCTIYDCGDGGIDITKESDYITVSWCKFYYTTSPPDPNHRFVNLIGADDGDTGDAGKLHVTMHHNWWGSRCKERMPRVRFGQVHLYNNFYYTLSDNYCIGVGNNSQIRLESSHFEAVISAWADKRTNGVGIIGWNSDNRFVGTAIPNWAPNDYPVFPPPYSYILNAGTTVKTMVQTYAGAETPDPPHWLYLPYGDFTHNIQVDVYDLEKFADYWLDTTDIWDADYFNNSIIDGREFALFAQNWMKP